MKSVLKKRSDHFKVAGDYFEKFFEFKFCN